MDGSTAVTITAETLQPIVEAVTSQLSISNIVGVIAIIIGAGVGFVFSWWGIRKLISVIQKAALKGKMGV